MKVKRLNPGKSAKAFTLIELVISVALMAMILGSAYVCLTAGVASQRLVETRVDIIQNARAALNIMTADLRSACMLSKEFQFLGLDRSIGEAEADNLDFGSHNYRPQKPGESDFCEMSYYLAKDPGSESYILWRRRDPTPDPLPLAGGTREEIARGLRGLKFEYYDGYDWYDEWGDPEGKRKGVSNALEPVNMSGIPDAVRITLWFESNLKGARKEGKGSDEETQKEPPFVFQTVARINLSRGWQRSGSAAVSIDGNGAPGASGVQAEAPK